MAENTDKQLTRQEIAKKIKPYLKKARRRSILGSIITGTVTVVFGAFALIAWMTIPALWGYTLALSTAGIFSGLSFLGSLVVNLRTHAALKEWKLMNKQLGLKDEKGKTVTALEMQQAAKKRNTRRGKWRRWVMPKKTNELMKEYFNHFHIENKKKSEESKVQPETPVQAPIKEEVIEPIPGKNLNFQESIYQMDKVIFDEEEVTQRVKEGQEKVASFMPRSVEFFAHDEDGSEKSLFTEKMNTEIGARVLTRKVFEELRNSAPSIYPVRVEYGRNENKDILKVQTPEELEKKVKKFKDDEAALLEPEDTAPICSESMTFS